MTETFIRAAEHALLSERVARIEERMGAATKLADERKEQVALAFAASEKAVAKAEQAQQRVNEGQNEFRGALKDQAGTLATKEELAAQAVTMGAIEARLAERIVALERGASAGAGKDKGMQPLIAIGLLIAAAAISYVVSLLNAPASP